MSSQIEVQIACDDAWSPELDDIRLWSSRAILAAGSECGRAVTVRVVGKDESRSLNRDFRQQDKPTNVLSFPVGAIDGLPDQEKPPLGDIVVCAAVLGAEAEAQGKMLIDHWAHIVVHGTLHLLGYDHETETDAAVMETLEQRILAAHGIADPYEESRRET